MSASGPSGPLVYLLANLVMPNSNPWDRFFLPYLTLVIDSYILFQDTNLSYDVASGSEITPYNKI